MAERFGYGAIEDAIVDLLNANTSELNNGISPSVQKIVTKKPDNIVIGMPEYPAICVWFDSSDREFRGASKRRYETAHYQVHFWTNNKYSVDASKDQADLLVQNLLYIFDSNIDISALSSTRGYLTANRVNYEYNTNESGFITHGYINLDVIRCLN